ncbi:MAG: GTP-binding protein [Chloroflexi bacterium]|nr:GTP-binding protein [Chloroflexota bacterium]
MDNSSFEQTIPTLKVIVAGDGTVGKTSLIRQYCEGKFEKSRVATIGVDFQIQTIELPSGTVKLSIWDVAGQKQFKSVREIFYRGALATALVFDVSNPESLVNLKTWHEEITSISPSQKFLVIGNKIDLQATHALQNARGFAASIKAGYLETSALSGEHVPEMFTLLAGLANSI